MKQRTDVVVGVDDSEGSRRALAWAVAYATERGHALRSVGAWSYPRSAALPGGPSPRSAEDEDAATGALVEERLIAAGRPPADHPLDRIVVERGPAARAILAAIGSSTDAVVVGKRGLGSFEGRLLGSVSRRVAELSPAPVVVVPIEDTDVSGPIVVGVDGSPAAAAARDWAVEAARASGRALCLVHGISGLPAEMPPSAIDRFIAEARSIVDDHQRVVVHAGVEVESVVDVADPRRLLHAIGDDRHGWAVVIGSSGDGPVAGVLVGSVVNHVVQQSDRPVVVVPPPRS